MSCEVLYDKAFIQVGDRYIPVINQGSTNCFEVTPSGREVPEKYWSVLNYHCRNKLLFTRDEIIDLAERMEEISRSDGTLLKSRNRGFADGELRSWLLAGIKRAYTVEEYVRCGNTLFFVDSGGGKRDMVAITTNQQLLELLEQKKEAKELNLVFADNRMVHRPKRVKDDKLAKLEIVYVLSKTDDKGRTRYLCKFRRNRFIVAKDVAAPMVRLFADDREAQSYLARYRQRLGTLGFHVEGVCNPRLKKGA